MSKFVLKTKPKFGHELNQERIEELEKRRGGKWVTLKEALHMIADKRGISWGQAFSQYKKGVYRDAWTIHWVNKRVVFVRVE